MKNEAFLKQIKYFNPIYTQAFMFNPSSLNEEVQ